MASLDAYLWVVVKKNLKQDKLMYDKVFECFKSVKCISLLIFSIDRLWTTSHLWNLWRVHVLDSKISQSGRALWRHVSWPVSKTQLWRKHLWLPYHIPRRYWHRESSQAQQKNQEHLWWLSWDPQDSKAKYGASGYYKIIRRQTIR